MFGGGVSAFPGANSLQSLLQTLGVGPRGQTGASPQGGQGSWLGPIMGGNNNPGPAQPNLAQLFPYIAPQLAQQPQATTNPLTGAPITPQISPAPSQPMSLAGPGVSTNPGVNILRTGSPNPAPPQAGVSTGVSTGAPGPVTPWSQGGSLDPAFVAQILQAP